MTEIQAQQIPIQSIECIQCTKKDKLLSRYEDLVSLYKKKSRKNNSASEISSNLKSSLTNTLFINIDTVTKIYNLYQIYCSLQNKRYRQFFDNISSANQKEQYLKMMGLIHNKYVLKRVFQMIKTKEHTTQLTQPRILVQQINNKNRTKQRIQLEQIKPDINNLKKQIGQFRQSILKKPYKNTGYKNTGQLIKQRLVLQMDNYRYRCINLHLEQKISDLKNRLERQSIKKKESLQILSEDLREKDNQIKQLRLQLDAYRNRYNTAGNILDSEDIQLRKQINILTNKQYRLNAEIEKLQQKIYKKNQQISSKTANIQQLNTENDKLKYKLKIYQQTQKTVQIKETELKSLIEIFQRKIRKLVANQQTIYLECQSVSKNQEISARNLKGIPSEIREQAIYHYIMNISIKDYQLRCSELFEIQHLGLLMQLKKKYIKMETEISESIQHDYIDENCVHYRGKISSGIFSSGDGSNDHKQQRGGITMKILQLEVEKSKLISKISQMKQKFMHFRVLVLNLLRSLQLQEGSIKTQTEGVLRVLFDIFEYSQQQRESIIVKKKKLFRFL